MRNFSIDFQVMIYLAGALIKSNIKDFAAKKPSRGQLMSLAPLAVKKKSPNRLKVSGNTKKTNSNRPYWAPFASPPRSTRSIKPSFYQRPLTNS
jgi:hypothetical protein